MYFFVLFRKKYIKVINVKKSQKIFKYNLKLISIALLALICFSGCEKKEDTTEVNSIEVNKTTLDITVNNQNNTVSNNTINTPTTNVVTNTTNTTSHNSETVISKFSTRIYSRDKNRQKNLEITSNTLNGTVVEPNETFSFTKTVGPSTESKGYEKADIFDSNGNKIKGYGGGNCQVSSTLYNAVLKAPSLKVVERHEHSNKVPYVAENKDAAVAYGSVDFKFKNENDYPIKILVQASKKYVVVTLVKI